jgi:hypothetical protein
MESLPQFLFWVCVYLVQAKKVCLSIPKDIPYSHDFFGEILGTILVPSFLWMCKDLDQDF